MKLKRLLPYILLSTIILVIGLSIASSNRNRNDSEDPSNASKFDLNPLESPSTINAPPITEEGQVDTESPEIKEAIEQKTSLKEHLPIYIENYPTSANINTTINLYSLDNEPEYTVHLEIYGIIYHNQSYNTDENPNALAFKESFLAAKDTLKDLGIDPSKLYYIYGSRDYIQQTAELWVEKLNLLQ